MIIFVALILAACTSDDAPQRQVGDHGTASTEMASSGIEAIQIDGVWVFRHDPDVHMTAGHSGTAEIKDGCLYIDDTVVIWDVDQLEAAERIVAETKAGVQRDLLIGGGGIRLDEGASPEDIPEVVSETCPTTAVWLGSASVETSSHPPCHTNTGMEEGRLRAVLHLGDERVEANYIAGTRQLCPWLVEDATVTTIAALDGAGVVEPDLTVEPNTELTLVVSGWSTQISHQISWIPLDPSDGQHEPTLTYADRGAWNLDAPDRPGDYILELRLDWEYGSDQWGWRIIVTD